MKPVILLQVAFVCSTFLCKEAEALFEGSFFEEILKELNLEHLEEVYDQISHKAAAKAELQALVFQKFLEFGELKKFLEPGAKLRLRNIFADHWDEVQEILEPVPAKLLELFDGLIETIWRVRRAQRLKHPKEISMLEAFDEIYSEFGNMQLSEDFWTVLTNSTLNIMSMRTMMEVELDDLALDFPNYEIIHEFYATFLQEFIYAKAIESLFEDSYEDYEEDEYLQDVLLMYGTVSHFLFVGFLSI